MNNLIRECIEMYPALYLSLLRLKRRKHWSLNWVVTQDTDFCIEGFPRSANSFAYAAFLNSQDCPELLRSATHTHSPAQIVQAVKWRIPTMLCIRKPRDAVCGLLAFERELRLIQGSYSFTPSHKEISNAASRWAYFHRRVLPFKQGLYVATFEEIIKDFECESSEFIRRFDMKLRPYDPQRVSESEIRGLAFHIGPNAQREALKKEVKKTIEESHSKIWDACDELYEKIVTT